MTAERRSSRPNSQATRMSRKIATKASVIACPVDRDRDPDADQDGRDRRGEGKPLHEQERQRHQRDDERQEPARPPAHPVHGGGVEPLDDAGEREEHGEALHPPDAHEAR